MIEPSSATGNGMMGGPSGATDTACTPVPVNVMGGWVSPESCVMDAEGAVGEPAPADAAAACNLAIARNSASACAFGVFFCDGRGFDVLGLLLAAS